jgi:hypothetical protein
LTCKQKLLFMLLVAGNLAAQPYSLAMLVHHVGCSAVAAALLTLQLSVCAWLLLADTFTSHYMLASCLLQRQAPLCAFS